jgi:hypothetical protein
MGTRGVIARAAGDGFAGRYHHWDSYPEGLGKALWDLAHGRFRNDLEGMMRFLIDEHPAGWSTIVGADFSQTPGFHESAKEEDVCLTCGKPNWTHYYQYYEKHGMVVPPEGKKQIEEGRGYVALGHSFKGQTYANAQCYCHGDRADDEQLLTEKNASASGCEYAYVFSTKNGGIMTVLSSYSNDGSKMIGMFGMGDPDAHWRILAQVELDGPDPDWNNLERQYVHKEARKK